MGKASRILPPGLLSVSPNHPADTAGCFLLYLLFPERVCGQGPALLVSPGGNELLSGASPPAPDAQRGFLAAAALTQGKTRQHQPSVTHKRPSPVGSPVLHSDPEDPHSVHQKAPQINKAGWTAQPSPHIPLGHPGAAAPSPCAQHLSEQPGSISSAVRGLPEPAGIRCTQPAKKANRWNLFLYQSCPEQRPNSHTDSIAPPQEISHRPRTPALASCCCRAAGSEETVSESSFPTAASLSCSHVLRDSATSWNCW